MADNAQQQRLETELEAMRQLDEQSPILSLDTEGDPPTKYVLTFRGKALKRDMTSSADVEIHELHRCEIRLPYSFPDRPPDVRWLTPLFHPNVSFSGLIRLPDIGMAWDKDLSLVALSERLWDMARYAFMDLDKASNFAAKSWAENPTGVTFPVDPRPLRGGPPQAKSNVVRYERRGTEGIAVKAEPVEPDVLYIGDDTPVPPMPQRKKTDDDDILYIGYDD
jgi:ubiquitin-protein ligase